MTVPVFIAGVAMTKFGNHEDSSVAELTHTAVHDAVADAGVRLSDIDSAFFGNTTQGALEGQLMIGGQVALRATGLKGIPMFNVENACATGSSALNLAMQQVRAGASDVALAVGAEKMNIGDRAKSMTVFDGAYEVAAPEKLQKFLLSLGADPDTDLGPRSIFMDIYAAWAREHMERYGTTQAQIAAVASKNHGHAVHNEKAHYRSAMTVEEIVAGRPLGYPLTVPMCSPITDGAAAVVVASAEAIKRLRVERPVKILASVVGTGVTRDHADLSRHVIRLAGQRAYEQAGLGPEDISVAELHDATAFAEILSSELLGFCPEGEGGKLAESGESTIGGRIPINPSGGLESKGHPLGATGLGQIHELTAQLRGEGGVRQVENARIALAENGGGFLGGEEAVCVVTILGADDERSG
jgi:acetyl-CoA acyltransferase